MYSRGWSNPSNSEEKLMHNGGSLKNLSMLGEDHGDTEGPRNIHIRITILQDVRVKDKLSL